MRRPHEWSHLVALPLGKDRITGLGLLHELEKGFAGVNGVQQHPALFTHSLDTCELVACGYGVPEMEAQVDPLTQRREQNTRALSTISFQQQAAGRCDLYFVSSSAANALKSTSQQPPVSPCTHTGFLFVDHQEVMFVS
jgi:hypothetical protein